MRGILIAAVFMAGLLAGCKKKATPVTAVTPPTVVAPPSTNYEAGGSALGNVAKAAKRLATQVELSNLGLLIESAYLDAGNKMPDEKSIMDEVKKTTPNLYAAYQEKTLIVCWTKQHDGVWAYQAGAKEFGGLALLSPGQARRVEADELKQLLGGN